MQIEKKDLIKLVGVVVIAIALIAFALNHKRTSAEASNKLPDGYTLVTSVPGVSFAVNTLLIDKATAVSQITDTMDFSRDDLYAYKNGEDKYLMFSLDQIVIASEKGTHFNFANNGADGLAESSVDGIWFSADQKKLDLDSTEERSVATVTGGVVITDELYNDFTGKLVTVNDGETEYSLFVGLPGTKYKKLSKNQKELIETCVDSFGLHTEPEKAQEPDYEVVISGNILNDTVSENNTDETTENTPEEIGETVSSDSVSDNTVSADAVSDNTVSEDSIEEITEGTEEPDDEIIIEEAGETDTGATEEPVPEEEAIQEETEEITEEAEEVQEINEEPEDASPETEEHAAEENAEPEPKKESKGIQIVKTEKKKRDKNTAYSSTKYSMLDINTTGLYELFDPSASTSTVEEAAVTINCVYGSDSAEKLYNEFVPKVGDKPELLPGCHWEAVEYSLKYSGSNKPYTDLKFVGLDGEALKFKGIKYPMRTYEVAAGTEEDNTKRSIVTIYAVPNGCLEYALKFGGDTLGKIRSAYFEIIRD